MSNIIIQSAKKEHVANILSGKKTYEFRKNKPKAGKYPYLVLLYETKDGGGRGGIVGAYMCSGVLKTNVFAHRNPVADTWREHIAREGCVTVESLYEYAKGRDIVAWNVRNPITFAEPLPLSKFGLTRAPQSWHYL